MTRRINCLGEAAKEERRLVRTTRAPNDVKVAGGCTYHRYGEGGRCAIHRIGIARNGMVEELWTFGEWAEAESLQYAKRIDETMEVDDGADSL